MIQLFNEIYINCKYQALMNMMILYNRNKDVILYGFIPKYEYSKDYHVYQVKNYTYRPISEILKDNGIIESSLIYSDNIIHILHECQKGNKCLIIRIDLYYTPYNLKFYKKQHYKRFILINNINEEDATIYDKDQYNNYKEYTQIPLIEIAEWYNGYINNYYKTGLRTDETIYLYELKEKAKPIHFDSKEIFIKAIKNLNNIFTENIKTLEDITEKIENKTNFEFNKTLEKFLNHKKIERYRYKIFKEDLLDKNIKRQEEIINEIRLVLLRNNENNEKILNKFKEFVELEKKINNKLVYLSVENIRKEND